MDVGVKNQRSHLENRNVQTTKSNDRFEIYVFGKFDVVVKTPDMIYALKLGVVPVSSTHRSTTLDSLLRSSPESGWQK